MKNIQAVLFDLDGTLLDTAPDLANALNALRLQHGYSNLPLSMIRPEASHGAKGLLKLGFGISEEDPAFLTLRDQLLSFYEHNIANETQLFEGMADVLNHLDEKSIAWGIVTNKPEHLTRALLTKTQLHHRTQCVVSGDTLPHRKPSPVPLYHACRLLGASEKASVFIGDAKRDIEAGFNAGMKTIIARYGYIGADDDILQWHADAIINSPNEIITLLDG